MIRTATIICLLALSISCAKKEPQGISKFSDQELLRVADFQDRRLTDSLMPYLTSSNTAYREAAALAFGSVQDTLAIEMLGRLLANDPDQSVRSAAAFALGQTGGARAAEYLLTNLRADASPEHWEAIGKTIQATPMAGLELSAWALYRLGLRGNADSTHISRAIQLLQQNQDDDTRLGVANFFSRGPSNILAAKEILIESARKDLSAMVRMASASALRKIVNEDVLIALKEMLAAESDYRVRVNLVRSLQPYPLAQSFDALSAALKDDQINVCIAAAETIRQSASSGDYAALVTQARAASNWRVRANLYGAALAVSGSKELSEEIVRLCRESQNPYETAALIEALSSSPMQFSFVSEQLSSDIPVIRTASASTLRGMNRHRDFEPSMQETFVGIYRSALNSGDPAVIGLIASTLSEPDLGYKNVISDFGFLYEARDKLSLPKDVEALQPLEAAIAYFEGRSDTPEVRNEYNHPIDWSLVKGIPVNQRVLVKTSRGDIEMQLLVEEAPGSVANFVQLAQRGYFNSKNFQRVVPNFVIQGGCNRGDGWGSEDYSIRSEFSRRKYKEGSVGMASAGKDTEGTQWFITHSPTPHLDGRYTIFAEVVSGMDVVHRIEVGDTILSVKLLQP